jgi:hypothetical protein
MQKIVLQKYSQEQNQQETQFKNKNQEENLKLDNSIGKNEKEQI